MSKYILIPDSFKGSLSSAEICAIITREIRRLEPEDAEDVSSVFSSEYPLVLYTCTPGGKARVAVFCQWDETAE